MLQKISFIFLVIFAVCLSLSAAAQTFPARDSKLAAVGLPGGAQQVEDGSVPGEIRDTLAKLVAAGGEKIRQGDSEVFLWSGNYKKANGSQMIKKLENSLKTSGWEYEIGEQNNEFVVFSLSRTEPSRRVLMGFFVPSEDVFIFAMTEMLAANASTASKQQAAKTNTTGSTNSNIVGKWFRTTGGGSIDFTGKTQYKAGENFYFEFLPDGTVEYAREKEVLTILQCRIKASDKARGTYTVSGNRLTINLGAMKAVGSSSCEEKDNFNKTLPASSVTKQFTVKPMESLARPDKPLMLCFDGDEGACFEKTPN